MRCCHPITAVCFLSRGPLRGCLSAGAVGVGLLLAAPAHADETRPPQVLSSVQPAYPSELLAEGLVGDVLVDVEVDAQGGVTAVQAVKGPAPFHAAAEAAARQLVLAPALLEGAPAPGRLRVRFHFEPPIDEEVVVEVTVHARDPDAEDSHARTTLTKEELERAAGQDLATTLTQVPGVVAAGGTTDQSKPIIRGQTERRLLLLNDGVRHEGQRWGPDHAPEIDPFSAGEISVIRGAAGVRYGPDAIGGVVLVQPPPMRQTRGFGGKAMLAGASNARLGYAGLRLDGATGLREEGAGWSLRMEGNHGTRRDAQAPNYLLGNTAGRTSNAGLYVERQGERSTLRLGARLHTMQAGVFYGVRTSTPDEFDAQFSRDRPVTADLWVADREVDAPFQDVSHLLATAHYDVDLDSGWSIAAIYAFQRNHRQEFEQVRSSVQGPQYDFTLRTHSVDLALSQPRFDNGAGLWSGTVGGQFRFLENVYRGWSLLPNHRGTGGGLFATERLSLGVADIEVGLRADMLDRQVYMDEDDYGSHTSRGSLGPGDCSYADAVAQCPSRFWGLSASIGGLLHVVPDHLDLKADVSRATRFPDSDELYLIGAAPSLPVFGLGDPGLGPETTWANSLTAGLRWPAIEAELSGFWNHTRDYIYFGPDIGPGGTPSFEVTISGAWPRYATMPINAVFTGADGVVSLGPDAVLGARFSGALVRAHDVDTGLGLVGTPADRASGWLLWRPVLGAGVEHVELGPGVRCIAEQTRTPLAHEFAPPPDGVCLLDALVEVELPVGAHHLRLAAEGRNLLNTAWRDYTSLMRFYADEPGRDLRLRATYEF